MFDPTLLVLIAQLLRKIYQGNLSDADSSGGALVNELKLADLIKLVDQIKVADHIKVADTLSISFHIDNVAGQSESMAIISPYRFRALGGIAQGQEQLPPSASSTQSILLQTQSQSQCQPITPLQAQFESGMHLIFNQKSWWDRFEPLKIGQITIAPLHSDDPRTLTTSEGALARPFKVMLTSDDRLTMSVWSNAPSQSFELRDTPLGHVFDQSGSNWQICAYEPSHFVGFPHLSNVVLSFDPQIVRKVVTIARRPNGIGKTEHYVLVLRNSIA